MTTLFLGKPCWAYILVKRRRPGDGYEGSPIGRCAIRSGFQCYLGHRNGRPVVMTWASHGKGSATTDTCSVLMG